MAVNDKESFGEKVKEFFLQNPEDREYEEQGGDARIPVEDRTESPRLDARKYALSIDEEDPYPEDGPLDGGALA